MRTTIVSLNSKRTARHDATLLSNDAVHRSSKRTITLDSILNKTFGRFPTKWTKLNIIA